MKKRGSLVKYLLTFLFIVGITYLFNIPKVYAGTAHDISFKVYNCYSLNEDALQDVVNPSTNRVTTAAHYECLGPNGDGNTPLMTTTNVDGVGNVIKIEPGQVIKVGFHYVPGSEPTIGVGMKFWYVGTSLEPVQFSKYNRTSRTYSPAFGYELGDDFDEYYATNNYSTTTGLSTLDDYKITYSTYNTKGSAGDPIEDEMDMVYYYFKVKDDAAANTKLDFTWDTAPSGISIGNGEPYTSTNTSVYVEVPLSEDNTLGALAVKKGSTTYPLTPEFTPGSTTVDSYTAYVPKNITSVDIEAEPNDTKATLTGDGTVSNLGVGNNNNTITVLSEAGEPKDYTVNIYRLSDDADLSTLTLSGIDFGTFDPDTTSYSKTVPYATSSTTVGATVHDTGKATASGTGNKDLQVGENEISVEVTPENCKSNYTSVPGNTCTKKTYTITITREAASTDATLSDLKVDNVQVPNFDPDTYEYTLDDVANSKASVNITYETTDSNVTSVTGTGNQNLSVGANALKVIVTAEDGTTKKTYTINIKRKSNDNTLQSLSVTASGGGTLEPEFASNKTSYTYYVGADENEVVIDATASNAGATVSGTGTYNPQNTPSVTITVTPEDGTAKDYVITFERAKSTNADLSNLTVDGTQVSGFDKDTLTYNLTVDTAKESVTIVGTPADSRAYISSDSKDGVQVLDYGVNELPVTVVAEDGTTTKTYTINITRPKKTDANLTDLKVDGTSVPDFSPDKTSYTLDDVEYTKSSVNITYITSDNDGAHVDGAGEQNLEVGDNALEVTVTAHDGTTTKTYTINIKRKSNDNTLKSLSVTASGSGSLDPEFASNKTSYTYYVGPDETEVVIDAVPNHEGATVSGTGTYNPQNVSSVTLTVTPESGSTKDYVITFDRAKSANADLSNLTVDGTQVSGFDKDTLTYNLTVDTNKESVNIVATKADSRASIPDDATGEKVLDYGVNEFPITVTAENGTTKKTYTVKVTRPKRTDANLTDLKVDGTTVPNFSEDKLVYNLPDVANEKSSVNITYTLSDSEGATIDGTGVQNLAVGDNALEVTVTAHDGTTTKTYTINIKRKSNDDTLKSLTITSDPAGTLNKDFDPDETEYTYTADADETEVVINAVANHDGATIIGTGTYNPQTTKKVEIAVTSENGGEPKIYTINLALSESTNANLSGLSVEGYDLDQTFDPDETEYTLTVPEDVNSINVIAELADDRATVSGDGDRDLNYGENEITVTVYAEDGVTEKTYTITVTRDKKSDATLSDLTVDGTTVPGFSADKFTYDLDDVPTDKNSIIIGYTTNDVDATVSGDGTKTLEIGDNSFEVVVTAHNGTTTKTYTINIHRNNDDTTLKTLTITSNPAGSLDQAFDPSETSYVYTIDRDTTEVVITAEANGEGASVSGARTYNPQEEESAEITVTSENGSTNVYTITFEKAKKDNANLESLEVLGYDLDQTFDPDETDYTLTVPNDVESINISAIAEDLGYATVSGDGTKTLTPGTNSFEIEVTADDGTTTKVYNLTVTRELSDDVKLSEITIDGEPIPGFDPDVPLYNVDVDKDTESVVIDATPQDGDATVNVDGPDELQVGDNEFTITVTAEDGTTTGTYTVIVTRAADDDATLKGLEVEGYDIDPVFDPNETNYTLTVPSDVDSVNIIADSNSDFADIAGDGTVNLTPGENVIEVVVTAQDGTTTKTYTITITKEEDDEKITSLVYGHEIDDTYILTGNLNAKGLNMKDELDNDNEKLTITTPATRDDDGNITEEGTEISDSDYIGTGYEVILKVNGVEKDRKIIVIKGDVDGNGEITLLDGVTTCYHYLGVSKNDDTKPRLTGAYLLAANVDTNDPDITLLDAVSIVYHYVGNVPISYKTAYTREGD